METQRAKSSKHNCSTHSSKREGYSDTHLPQEKINSNKQLNTTPKEIRKRINKEQS